MAKLPEATVAAKFVIKTHYIMRVLEFHPETQTVDLIQDVFEMTNSPFGNTVYRNEFGNIVACLPKELDILYDVPVKQLRWGQFEIQACPVEGDTGYIEVFVDDIQDWIKNGSRSIPWSVDKFVKKNCVFVPFVPNKKNASATYPADNTQLVIRSKNASITITDDGNTSSVKLNSDKIYLGGDANQPAVLGNDLVSLLTNLISAYNTHTHIGNLGVPTAPPSALVEQTDIISKKTLVE